MHRRTLLATAAATTVGHGATTAAARPSRTAPLSPTATLDVLRARDFVTDADGDLAYVAAFDGFVVLDVSDPASPSVLATRRGLLDDHPNGPLAGIRDVKLAGDRLLVSGQAWADGGSGAAVVTVDVSDPSDPRRLTVHETDHAVHNAAFDGETAYLTGSLLERWPVVVVRFAGGESRELARWSVVDADERWADLKPGVRRVHDVHLDGDRLYAAYWDAGTRVLDVSDPGDPTQVAVLGGRDPETVRDSPHYVPDRSFGPELFELPGNAAAARTNGDGTLLAVSKEAFDTTETDRRGGPGPIDVWDVSDRSTPRHVATVRSPRPDPSGVGNAKNCAWRGDTLYAAWRSNGVAVYDFATPAEPTVLGRYNAAEFDVHTVRTLGDGFAALQNTDSSKDRPGRLFTFPEPSGTDPRPAETGSPLDGPAPTTTTDPEPTRTPRASTTEPPADTTRRETTATTADSATAGTGSTTATSTDATPGFTATAAVAGGVLAWLSRRRR